ncbi:MAG: hypothetical protein H7345_05495 [Rubritepida sp.]|nr:hypothetical protein [Rubritepida sp.]
MLTAPRFCTGVQVGRKTIRTGSAIVLSDGVVRLALLNFAGGEGHAPALSAPVISETAGGR